MYKNPILKACYEAELLLPLLIILTVELSAHTANVFILASWLRTQFSVATANVLCNNSLHNYTLGYVDGLIFCPWCKTVFFLSVFLGFRFYYNDATAIHQLQDEVCSPPPVEDAHLQGPQYLY